MQRLQTRAQFQAVLAGKVIARTQYFALHCVPKTPAIDLDPNSLFGGKTAWVGALTPKRAAKRAVTRNLVRRLIYSVCTDLGPLLQMVACVVRLSVGIDKVRFPSASSQLLRIMLRKDLLLLFAKARLGLPTIAAESEVLPRGET